MVGVADAGDLVQGGWCERRGDDAARGRPSGVLTSLGTIAWFCFN